VSDDTESMGNYYSFVSIAESTVDILQFNVVFSGSCFRHLIIGHFVDIFFGFIFVKVLEFLTMALRNLGLFSLT